MIDTASVVAKEAGCVVCFAFCFGQWFAVFVRDDPSEFVAVLRD